FRSNKNQKFTSASFSLNQKYPITKFLNLKLTFHATKTAKQTNTIRSILKRCQLKSHTEGDAALTGAILIIGSTIKKKIRIKRYNTNTFGCLVNLVNLWNSLTTVSER
ncbi:MAG: hypothetical protein WC875_05710, partial [Candidatus Absconditabacterales bacterium]